MMHRAGLFRAAMAAGALALALLVPAAARAGGDFPFDQELLLDTAPLGAVKRVPILTVESNGEATIDLWCKSVSGHVDLADGAIRITAAPLPDALPSMTSAGQCSPERQEADQQMLASILQATAWRRHGDTLVLFGSVTLRFFLASN